MVLRLLWHLWLLQQEEGLFFFSCKILFKKELRNTPKGVKTSSFDAKTERLKEFKPERLLQ